MILPWELTGQEPYEPDELSGNVTFTPATRTAWIAAGANGTSCP